MTDIMTLTDEIINYWADNKNDPVALHLKQKLIPVEVSEHAIIFPPTYADIGYNIDTLTDGTKVVTIDSVGSQANRIEPVFKEEPYSALVPQIEIKLRDEKSENGTHTVKYSLLDFAHRSADAVVMSCPDLASQITSAFRALHQSSDSGPLCELAPTSLLFGVWDSRGGTGEKRPRLIRSLIRAWDVEPLYAAAQFNSIWKALDENQKSELEKEAKSKKTKLSAKGFADAPATFRKVSQSAAKSMTEFKNGAPNPDRRVLGGVMVSGSIERDVTVNLSALRKINGEDDVATKNIRRYLLSITLLAATADFDLYLREGCHLRFAGEDEWYIVPRRGERISIDLISNPAQKILLNYANEAVKPFKSKWPEKTVYDFDMKEAKKLLAKKVEEEESED